MKIVVSVNVSPRIIFLLLISVVSLVILITVPFVFSRSWTSLAGVPKMPCVSNAFEDYSSIKALNKKWTRKGDVTRYDSQRRFLAQHSIATLLRHCFEWPQKNLKIYFNTVKNSSGFLLHIKCNHITIINNNKYISKESLKNTTQNYTKLYLFSTNATYLT